MSDVRWYYGNIGMVLPSEIDSAMQVIKSIPASAVSILDALSGILDVIRSFISAVSNPFSAILQQLVDQIQSILDSLFNSGLYFLSVTPSNVSNNTTQQVWGVREDTANSSTFDLFKRDALSVFSSKPCNYLNPSAFMQAIRDSLYDSLDLNRPMFEDTDVVGAIVFMITTADATRLSSSLLSLANLFNLDFLKVEAGLLSEAMDSDDDVLYANSFDIESNSFKYNKALHDGDSVYLYRIVNTKGVTGISDFRTYHVKGSNDSYSLFTDSSLNNVVQFQDVAEDSEYKLRVKSSSAGGTSPDWVSFNLKKIEPLENLYKQFSLLLSSVTGLCETATSALDSLLDVIESKIDFLRDIAIRIDSIINMFYDSISQTGVYMLVIPPSSGGMNYLYSSLSTDVVSVVDGTELKLSSMVTGYTAGFAIVGGGLGVAGIEALQQILSGFSDIQVPSTDFEV